MHNWHILLLLILTVLQQIFSETRSIDGEQCCIRSSRSLTEEKLSLNGQYGYGKSPSEKSGLNDRSENEYHRHTNEVRESERASFIGDRRIQDHAPIPNGRRKGIAGRRLYRSVSDGSSKDRRLAQSQYFKNLIRQNGAAIHIPLYITSSNKHEPILRKQELARASEINKNRITDENFVRSQDRAKAYIKDNDVRIKDTHIIYSKGSSYKTLNRNLQPDMAILNTYFRKYEGVLRDNNRHVTSFERGIRQESANKRNHRQLIRSLEERYRNINSKDSTSHITTSLNRSKRQENTKINTNRQLTRHREERLINIRNEPIVIKNYKRYSRDSTRDPIDIRNHKKYSTDITRDLTSAIERGVIQEKPVINSLIPMETRNGEERNINVRNGPVDIRNHEGYLRDNTRDKTTMLERGIRQKAQKREKRNTIVRNYEPLEMRNNKMYFRVDSHDRKLSIERNMSEENPRKTTGRQMVHKRVGRSTNVRYDTTDIKNCESYLRDNTRDMTPALERGIHQENNRKNTDRQMVRNRGKLFTDTTEIKNNERVLGVNTRDMALTLERCISEESTRKLTDRLMAHKHEEININIRNKPSDIENYERFSRDNIRYETSLLKRRMKQENTRKNNDRQVARNREERNTNIRNEPINIRNNERYSRDNIRDKTQSLERGIIQDKIRKNTDRQTARNEDYWNTNERNELTDIRTYERYSRDNIRDKTSSLECGTKENTRKSTDRQVARNREEKNTNIRNEPVDYTNYEIHSRDNIRDMTLSLERGTQENTRRNNDRQAAHNREERNTNIRNEPINIRNNERYSRDNNRDKTPSLERGTKENTRKSTDRQVARNREERNTNIRNEPVDYTNYEIHSRDNIRDKTSSLERGTHENIRKNNDRQVARNREERNTKIRDELTDIRTYERYSRDNIRDKTSSLERGTKENTRKSTDRQVARNREEWNTNIRNEPADYTNYEINSRDNIRDKTSSLERGTQENTRKNTDRQVARKREERNKNTRNKPMDYTNYERHSRDNIHDKTSALERGIKENTRKNTDRQVVRNRVERNANIRNEPIDVTNYERYSRINIRDKTSSLERGIKENPRKNTDRQVARNREERNINVRNEPIDVRNYERYSRDNTRDKTSSLERGIIHDNTRKNTNRQMARNEDDRNTNIRNEPIDARNKERYSRNNMHDRTSSLERGIVQDNARKNTDREVGRNREERNTNIRNEPINIRSYERYSRDNIRDKTSSLERGINENIRKNIDRQIARNRDERRRNVRNVFTDVRNYERYSRDNIRDMTSLLQGGIKEYQNSDREIANNREERKPNLSHEPTDIRSYEKYSRDQKMNRNRVERSTKVRNEDTDIINSRRYSKDITRDNKLLLERDIKQTNNRKNTNRQIHYDSEGENTNERNEQTARKYKRHSRGNITDRTSALGRGMIQENSRKSGDRQVARNRQEQTRDVRNEPTILRTDLRNYERQSKYELHHRTLSLEDGIRQENTRRISDRVMMRKKRNINTENELINGGSYEQVSKDNALKKTSCISLDARSEYARREHVGSYRHGPKSVERNQPTNNERYSKYNTRGSTLKETVKRDHNNGKYLRYNTRATMFSIEHHVRHLFAKTDGTERYNSKKTVESINDRIREYRYGIGKRDALDNRRNSLTMNRRDENLKRFSQHPEFNSTLKASTSTKPKLMTTGTSLNESSSFYWQYLCYALQGIYIIGIFMQENTKTRYGVMDWLTPSQLLKVD